MKTTLDMTVVTTANMGHSTVKRVTVILATRASSVILSVREMGSVAGEHVCATLTR